MKGGAETDKKNVYRCAGGNLSIGIFAIFSTIVFMLQVFSVFITIRDGGVISDIQYSVFLIKIRVTTGTYSPVYTILNYPVFPIAVGVIYNLYHIIKYYISKDNADLNSSADSPKGVSLMETPDLKKEQDS